MGEIKNRSVRLDDENYGWLTGLPGRSLNEAVGRLRTAADIGTPFEKQDAIAELLELVRSLPDTVDFEEVVRRVIQEAKIGEKPQSVPSAVVLPSASEPFEEEIPVVDKRPKNCRCQHCGKPFAGPRFSTLCSDCKSAGHTLSPAECPKCNEGTSI